MNFIRLSVLAFDWALDWILTDYKIVIGKLKL